MYLTLLLHLKSSRFLYPGIVLDTDSHGVLFRHELQITSLSKLSRSVRPSG